MLPALLLCACDGLLGLERMPSPLPAPEADPGPAWQALLQSASSAEGVDYDRVAAEAETLHRFVAWVGAHGPQSDGLGESKEDQNLAFLINAYNALVVFAVLERRPLASVQDLELGPLDRPGAGFFFAQRFLVDGEWLSLHSLERQYIVDRYQEPLVHAALVCASKGCPQLRWYTAKGLQNQLQAAMRGYIDSEAGMRLQGETASASPLFQEYRDDFLDWSADPTLCAWMEDHAFGERRRWLHAHASDCPLEFHAWDGSLNQAQVPVPDPGSAPAPAPPEELSTQDKDSG